MHTLGQLRCFFLDLKDATEKEVGFVKEGQDLARILRMLKGWGPCLPLWLFALQHRIFASDPGECIKI